MVQKDNYIAKAAPLDGTRPFLLNLSKYLVDEAAGFVFAGIEDVGVGFCGDGY